MFGSHLHRSLVFRGYHLLYLTAPTLLYIFFNLTPHIQPGILWLNRTVGFVHPSMAAYRTVMKFIQDLLLPVLIKLIWSVIFLTDSTYHAKGVGISILGPEPMTSQSYSANWILHRSSLDPESFTFMTHTKGLWPLNILNFRPYIYGLQYFVAHIIRSSSFSLVV